MKTLYISDLDGTLLQNNSKILMKSCEILNKLVKRGIYFSYATARSIFTARDVTEDFHLNLPVITKNGVIITNPDTCEIITKNIFSKEEAEDIFQILSMDNIQPIVFSYQDEKEKFSYNVNKLSEEVQWFLSEHEHDERTTPVSDNKKLLSGEVFYFSCIDTNMELQNVYHKIQKKFRCIFSKDTYNERMWLEIMPECATKASAILQLKEMFDFDYVVAFGDGINDIPMFEIADECYAVENAVEDLKRIATGVIGSNQSDGVARWIGTFYPVEVKTVRR